MKQGIGIITANQSIIRQLNVKIYHIYSYLGYISIFTMITKCLIIGVPPLPFFRLGGGYSHPSLKKICQPQKSIQALNITYSHGDITHLCSPFYSPNSPKIYSTQLTLDPIFTITHPNFEKIIISPVIYLKSN